MAITKQQLANLLTDQNFLKRVQVCVLAKATYIRGLGVSPPGAEQAWARRMLAGAYAACAAELMPDLINNATLTGSTAGDGSDITDAALQTAVESCCELYG